MLLCRCHKREVLHLRSYPPLPPQTSPSCCLFGSSFHSPQLPDLVLVPNTSAFKLGCFRLLLLAVWAVGTSQGALRAQQKPFRCSVPVPMRHNGLCLLGGMMAWNVLLSPCSTKYPHAQSFHGNGSCTAQGADRDCEGLKHSQ